MKFAVHEAIVDIPPSEFSAYVKELHRDADKGFGQQYAALQAHSPALPPCKAAQRDCNIAKNRYNNILPCKHPSHSLWSYSHFGVCGIYNHIHATNMLVVALVDMYKVMVSY